MENLESKGDYYKSQGLYEQAIEVYKEALSFQKSTNVYMDLASCYEKTDQLENAEACLTELLKFFTISSIKSEDDFYETLFRRGNLYKKQMKLNEAIEDFRTVYSKSSNRTVVENAKIHLDKALAKREDVRENLYKLNEREQFVSLFREHMAVHPGAEWHVVSNLWFQKWQKFVGLTSREGYEDLPFSFDIEFEEASNPGIINNSDIIDEDHTNVLLEDRIRPSYQICLKNGLSENINYVLLPQSAFRILYDKYGCSKDIKRHAIEVNDSIYQVEVYLKTIKIGCPTQGSLEVELINMSRKDTIGDLKNKFNIAKDITLQVRIWKVSLTIISLERLQSIINSNGRESKVYIEGGSQLKENLLIDDAEIGEEDLILIEPTRNGLFYFYDDRTIAQDRCAFCQKTIETIIKCKNCRKIKYCSEACRKKHLKEHKPKCKRSSSRSLFACFCRPSNHQDDSDEDTVIVINRKPIDKPKIRSVGLQNLGNTCFMNSSLQCLFHTEELTSFFLSNSYLKDINKVNPLGTKGKLATAYAELLENLWNAASSSYAPWKFKKTLSQFAPQFLGYQQHDAHELLCYILDGLHEDLNKVKKKPYFEDLDVKNKSDKDIAKESWNRHIARNQSIIVDFMHGQYKSTLYCPQCKNYSHTFDPFSSLSLPIPIPINKKYRLYFIYAGSQVPSSLTFDYSSTHSISYLRQRVSEAVKINPNSFIFICVVNDIVKDFPADEEKIDSLKNITLFAYEVETGEDQDLFEVQISQEKTKDNRMKNNLIAFPRVISIYKVSNFKQIHYEVFRKMKQYIDKYKNRQGNIKQLYEDHLNNPTYNLYLRVTKTASCSLCRGQNCTGCQIPYSDESYSEFFKKKPSIELRFKHNFIELGVNHQDMNKCTELAVTNGENKQQNRGINLHECFQAFRVPEELEKENAWYCPSCKAHVLATKQMEIYKAPSILVIHLKRFRTHGYYREKIGAPILFPVNELDISQYVIGDDKPPVYDLYAVSNHFGGLGGGHYTATCYSKQQEKWLEFNDSLVSGPADISGVSSYILFYKARNNE